MNRLHSICLYALSGSGKTSFLGELVQELLKDLPEGSKARLYTCEHYGTVQHLINSGIIDVWKVDTRPFPFETSRKAADGYWPADPSNPESALVAPTAETWQKFPIRIYEGMATFAKYLSGYTQGGLLDRVSRGENIGPKQDHVQFSDGEENVGGHCWATYGIGQTSVEDLVRRSQKRNGYVIWTSHEDEGKDKGQKVVGPEVFGSKLTGTIGLNFQDLFRIGQIAHDFQTEAGPRRVTERRLYVKNHLEAAVPYVHLAKNSAGLDRQAAVPEYFRLTDDAGLPDLGKVKKIVDTLWRRS